MEKNNLNRISLIAFIFIFCMPLLYGLDVARDDQRIVSEINQEHRNTRSFISDELTRQKNDFFTQMDDRANYYEREADSIMTKAVWKFGIVWMGVTFLALGFNNFLSRKLEQKRYKLLKDSLIADIKKEQMIQKPQSMQTSTAQEQDQERQREKAKRLLGMFKRKEDDTGVKSAIKSELPKFDDVGIEYSFKVT